MQSKKTLVLFVADYPNPSGEPFLEDELKVIWSDFQKIYLIQTNSSQIIAGHKMFVPSNATIISISESITNSFLEKLSPVFRLSMWYQVFLAVIKHRVRFSFSLIKTICYYFSESSNKKKKIKNLIKSNEIDINVTVFYSYWCDVCTFALARFKKENKGIHFITRVHGWDLYFERHKESFLPFREFIFKHADRIFPVSQDGRKYLLDKRLISDSSKIITSYLGVRAISRNPRYTKGISVNSKEIHLLSLSHINYIKRLDKIIDALCVFNDDFDFVWHHIGWGDSEFEKSFKETVSKKIEAKNNIHVNFHGRYSKEEVRDFLQMVPVDFIVNSSDTEGVPVSLMEAAASGIPAIAFDVGGIPAVVRDGQNGILISNKQKTPSYALFEAISSFIQLPESQKIIMSDRAIALWESSFNQDVNFINFSRIIQQSDSYIAGFIECSKCLVNNQVHPEVVFNKYGICDICEIIESKNNQLQEQIKANYLPQLLRKISKEGINKPYDCLIGISGGVDSAYLALKMKEQGLRPLLVHVDNGWNSEIAVSNIEKLITSLGFDLYTVVIDWAEIQDIVKSFMKASVIDIDWANEMCFVASLYKVAHKFGIKSVLTGHQISSEGWMPETVVHYKLDLLNFKAIHRKFGTIPLRTYPTIGYLSSFYYRKILGVNFYYPLDYLGYDKEIAKKELIKNYGWRDYGQKHFESIFTRFYQAYLLPRKFGVDKRIFHYSALIVSSQMTKKDAEKLLQERTYFETGQFDEDKIFIQKKMGFTESEFDDILTSPPKSHFDYFSLLLIRRKWIIIKQSIMGI